jgi:peptide chain release factor 1
MFDKIRAIEERYTEIEALLAQPEVASDYERVQSLAKERASLADLASLHRKYSRIEEAVRDAQEMTKDTDPEMARLAHDEISSMEEQRLELEQQLKMALIPRDPNENKDVITEIRAGTGGEEAALFAADLYRMYTRYAISKNWKVEVIDTSLADAGGVKEIVFEVQGKGAYSRLKHESGVHRVQRVPITEASGRIHTSTATVAVLPAAEEVDIRINSDDLRIDIFHAGGAGGQNVNKVASAVRITHLSTGIVAVCQDERSQLRNKNKALAVLRSRLLDMEIRRQQAEVSSERRSQVGTGERSEKVRTYNFPQDRLTDHRIGLSVHGLPRIMDGDLDSIIDALAQEEQTRKLDAASV